MTRLRLVRQAVPAIASIMKNLQLVGSHALQMWQAPVSFLQDLVTAIPSETRSMQDDILRYQVSMQFTVCMLMDNASGTFLCH